MTATIERYGTVLRCYDNGGKTCDRYTIIPPRWANERVEQAITRYRGQRTFEAIAANAAPFHPQGFGQHVAAVPGSHLGRRVHWDDLPDDVQRFARQSFPEYAPGIGFATYHRPPTPGEVRFGYGAVHYRDFPIDTVRVMGKAHSWGAPVLKKWIVADDGLRYYKG